MADYYGACRTNYFRVSNMVAFRRLVPRIVGLYGERAEFISQSDDPDKVGFLIEDGLGGLEPEVILDGDEPDYNPEDVARAIQSVIADGDACIIYEVGREKMRYLTGSAYIITKDKLEYIDIIGEAEIQARKMLRDKGWKTESTY